MVVQRRKGDDQRSSSRSFLYVFKYDNSGQFCSQPITRWASAHDILPKIILIPNELLYMLILCIPCQSVNVLL